jgi:hypothetical protein
MPREWTIWLGGFFLLALLPLFFVENTGTSGLIFFAGLGITFALGRRFFGAEAMFFAVMVLLGTLFLPDTLKWAGEGRISWVLLAVAALATLGYLKEPRPLWRFLVWLSWIPALLIDPIGAFSGLLGLALVWRFRHPQGKRLDDLYLWIIGPVLALVGWQLALFPRQWEFGEYGMQLLALLPWWGFLAAALAHLGSRAFRNEEISILFGGLLLGGLLSGSPFLQWALALLIAKQAQRVFEPGYPFGGLVKTILVLHLIAFVIAGIVGLIYVYYDSGGSGFRRGVGIIMAYWIPAFFGAVGLFGRQRQTLMFSLVLAALALSALFWAQSDYFPDWVTLLKR